MLWENLREEEFKGAVEKSGKLCLITIGCMEKHGQHLPLGTDVFIAESVVDRAAELTDSVVLHTGPWFGEVSCFHADKDPDSVRRMGNIAIKQSTLLTVLEELCDECGRNGFTKVLILNSHGGNVHMLNHFLRCQTYEDKPYCTMWAWAVNDDDTEPDKLLREIETRREEFSFVTEEDINTIKGWMPKGYMGGHADIREVALTMADHPELIAPDRYEAEDGYYNPRIREVGKEGLYVANAWYAASPNCYNGRPAHGTTMGIAKAMQKINVERLVRIINRVKANDDIISVAQMDRPQK